MDFCMQMVKDMMLVEMKSPNRKNTILSPMSFNVLLNMIAVGMTGDSLELMLNKLKAESVEDINKKSCDILAVVNNTDERGPTVTSINGVWVDKSCPLKASYEELLKRIYNCEANKNCDFAMKEPEVRSEINSWAESASRGLIKSVLESPLDRRTKFVRANALYFKGSWSKPFNPQNTYENQFHLLDETTVQVPFLSGDRDTSYDYRSFDGYKVLKLPYQNGSKSSFSMYFFLPNERNGLPNFLKTFNLETMEKLELSRTDLDAVRIPKFKFSYEINASKTMKKMELEMPYNGNQLDYAGMVQFPENLPSLYPMIFQKAFIEIDEYGTEASAVTIEVTFGGCMRQEREPKPTFVADHPFMFVIKEDISGLVLFTGMVLKPDSSTMKPKTPTPRPRDHRFCEMFGPPPHEMVPPYGHGFMPPKRMVPPSWPGFVTPMNTMVPPLRQLPNRFYMHGPPPPKGNHEQQELEKRKRKQPDSD